MVPFICDTVHLTISLTVLAALVLPLVSMLKKKVPGRANGCTRTGRVHVPEDLLLLDWPASSLSLCNYVSTNLVIHL